MKKRLKKFLDFMKNELWSVDVDNASKPKRMLFNFLQIVSLGFKGFKEDKLNVRASALTYFTLLSIVPVLALGFGIAKGFGLESMLESELTKNLAGQEEVLKYILDFTKSMVGTAKGGLIAGLGFVLLLWSVIKLLSNIENSFNTVWDIRRSRSLLRKFTDYLSIMLLGPIFMILAGSISIFISSQISELQHGKTGMFEFASPIFLQFAQIIPFIIIWVIFTILYLVMPNTKVKFRSAIIAGIIAGTMFQIFQNLYIYFQSGATRINAIYGSFAALPLFLIWLQTSWFVVLLGAEISFVVQSVKLKGASIQHKKLSIAYQKKIALLLVKLVVDYFNEGKTAPTSDKLASKSSTPIYTVEYILDQLVKANIISKVLRRDKIAYQPARSIDKIDIVNVINAYEKTGIDLSHYIKNNTFKELEGRMNKIQEFQMKSEDNILFKDLLVK